LPVLVCVWLLAVVTLQQLPVVWLNRARRYGAMLPYVTLAPVWAWLVWQGVRRRAGADDGGSAAVSLRLGHPVALLVVGLVLVNALTPYLGLKTRYSFTMYSNIRTEADLWNHLVVPSAVRVAELEDDLVRVTRVTGAGADAAAIVGAQVPTGEARRVLAPHPDAIAVYEMEGRRHVADPVASDATVGTPLPVGMAKLAGFRPVEPVDVCQH
jgi:hypothetical protein